MIRWLRGILAVLAGLGTLVTLLVTLGERRFRRVRREIVAREDERHPGPRPSRLRDLVASLAPVDAEASGLSGHALLSEGPEALSARLALIDAASDTIDLQYYMWHADLAGHLVARHVIGAAGRGVRVRVLLDDLHASGTRELVEALASHPLVRVRVYNASLTRRAYYLHWLFAFARLNRRMHNKALVVDGAVAIVGGRNIGNPYYGLADRMNFRDCDALVAGTTATAVARSVERYWNSDTAMPSSAFGIEENAAPEAVADHVRRLSAEISREANDGRPARSPDLRTTLDGLIWCRSSVVDDLPGYERSASRRVVARLRELIGATTRSLEFESGYFVPGAAGVARLAELVARGVRVRALTNSFATTDVLPAQAGYAKHRDAILEAGVELHELRPEARVRRLSSLLRGSIGGSVASAATVAGLHSKVVLIDGRVSVIGSFNLDQRSALDNTEVALVIDDEAFAALVSAFLSDGRSSETSYRVERGSTGPGGAMARERWGASPA